MEGEEPQQLLPGLQKEEGRRVVVVEALAMPTPLGTSINHLGQLYSSFRRHSLCILHNDSSFSLDGLTACSDFRVDFRIQDVHIVQSSRCVAVVSGSAPACVRIVQQVWDDSGLREMTETSLPLTARVACAG